MSADPQPRPWAVGVDSGGTFTDVVLVGPGAGLWVAKVPSTPDDPGRAVMAGIRAALASAALGAEGRRNPPLPEQLAVIHGSTVATNALLERRGARTALVTTRGFEDLVAIGRQSRPDLYALEPRREPPLAAVTRGVDERVGPEGHVLRALDPARLPDLARDLVGAGVESVAICLLHSYARSRHERQIAAALRAARLDVTLSSELVGEFREVERAWSTLANAYVAPIMRRYLRRLSRRLPKLRVMLSSGGSAAARYAVRQPIRTLLSGPAGGVIGARGEASAAAACITFDMGGTSTDVAVCGERPPATAEMRFAGMTLRTPVLDIHTVGAGGGSIATVDAGGVLRVGPRSAGARPGPACYGQGGVEATVTDANLVLGRLVPERFLDGAMALDAERAREVLAELGARLGGRSAEQAALGVIRVACAVMARAIREITVARGIDPRDHELVAFGGAGPMHAAALADELGIAEVRIPPDPGTLSARGMLVAPAQRALARSLLVPADDRGLRRAERLRDALAGRVRRALSAEGAGPISIAAEVDLRYQGQAHELRVPFDRGDPVAAFHRIYERRYGSAMEDRSVEIVTVRANASAPGLRRHLGSPAPATSSATDHEQVPSLPPADFFDEAGPARATVHERRSLGPDAVLRGPAVVVEPTATTVVPRAWTLRVDAGGSLLLTPERPASEGRA